MVACVINACRSNPLNMSAMGTVPSFPLLPSSRSCFLNNLKELLSGAAVGFKRDPRENRNCGRLTLIMLNLLRGEE